MEMTTMKTVTFLAALEFTDGLPTDLTGYSVLTCRFADSSMEVAFPKDMRVMDFISTVEFVRGRLGLSTKLFGVEFER